MYRTSVVQQDTSPKILYANKDNPLSSINPNAIKQGRLGNCAFLATLSSFAQSSPEFIKDMIVENEDGTYTVTFKGAPDEPITVSAPTEPELGLYNTVSEYGTWASVIEKAYGKYCQQSVFRRTYLNIGGGCTLAEGAEGGGYQGSTMRFLTGNSSDVDDIAYTRRKTTIRKLTESFNEQSPRTVTARSAPSFFGAKSLSADGFTTSHLYSVTGYDPAGPDGGTITVRNPWGWQTEAISMKVFEKNFYAICYERDKK